MDDDPEGGLEEAPEQKDKVQTLKDQVDGVIHIMTQNVEQVVARGENVVDLEDKSMDLEEGAKDFQHRAIKVNRAYRWKNVKLTVLIVVIVLIIVIIIVLLATGVIPVNTTTEP